MTQITLHRQRLNDGQTNLAKTMRCLTSRRPLKLLPTSALMKKFGLVVGLKKSDPYFWEEAKIRGDEKHREYHLLYHPDRFPSDRTLAEKILRAASEIWQVLKDRIWRKLGLLAREKFAPTREMLRLRFRLSWERHGAKYRAARRAKCAQPKFA